MNNFLQKITVWHKDVIMLALLNVWILTDLVVLSDIAGIIFLAIFPGVLIMRLLSFKPVEVWERIVHVVGLSISFVMFAGLAVNTLLPAMNILRPLALLPVLISFDAVLLFIIITNAFLKRQKRIFFDDISVQDATRRMPHHFLTCVLPILAIIGATVLNNGGPNIVTGITICAIAIFLFYVCTSEDVSRESSVITGLYCASLALLLVSSMRSWHVLGWDINAELQVFWLTQTSMYWSMSHLQDAYNACLSITLLPTIFSNFVHLSDEYIYKFLFQSIFALMPIVVFYFVRIFTNFRIAIFAVVMLIGNVVFSHGMPALIRQEFALLYFGLILLVLFSSRLNAWTRIILAVIYGTSIIMSHYSTTYITIFLLGLTVSLNLGLLLAKKVFPRMFPGSVSHSISPWYVVFLVVGTVLWGSVITKTSNNIGGFFDHSRSNIAESFTYDTLLRAVVELFAKYPRFEDIDEYKDRESVRFRELHPDMVFYESELTDQVQIDSKGFVKSQGILGYYIEIISGKIFQVLKLILNNLFILLGMMLLIYQWYVKKFASSEFILLGASGFIALGLILILPDALTQYNIDRLYFQLIMIWSVLSVTAGLSVLSFMSIRKRFLTLGVMYVALMLFYSSLVFSITGGAVLVSVSNFGADYEKFYTHEGEISAARWLDGQGDHAPIFTNSAGYLRLRSHSNIDPKSIFMTMLPSMIDKNSYVFLTRMNVVSNISTYIYYNEEYGYTTPIDFLNKNKDSIYDSGVAKIFR